MLTSTSLRLSALHARQLLTPSNSLLISTRPLSQAPWPNQSRNLLTLAIETSCDDTCVAVLETHDPDTDTDSIDAHLPADPTHAQKYVSASTPIPSTSTPTSFTTITTTRPEHRAPSQARLHFCQKVTASETYKGIHPVHALESHHASLGDLVLSAMRSYPLNDTGRKPDFIAVTRGPGMRTNLGIGVEFAKGLGVALGVGVVGVHHMLGHLLTPRLVGALKFADGDEARGGQARRTQQTQQTRPRPSPSFPFLSLLVSGGHTLLASSTSLTSHTIVADTLDLAIGNMIDRAARLILPSDASSFRGPAFEQFAWPNKEYLREYIPLSTKIPGAEISRFGWAIRPPLAGGRDGKSAKTMAFSFSGLLTGIERALTQVPDPETGGPTGIARDVATISLDERRELARHAQMIAFEHLLSRVLMHLDALTASERRDIKTLVVSGGVAANGCLRHVLRTGLDARGYKRVELCIPPAELCVDNAAMIAWAGTEMWNQGWRSELGILPIKEWSLDASVDGGGVLGVDGWVRR